MSVGDGDGDDDGFRLGAAGTVSVAQASTNTGTAIPGQNERLDIKQGINCAENDHLERKEIQRRD